ncbi:hypothetical protein QTP70_017992, partial [Hemibagrus guttatus]
MDPKKVRAVTDWATPSSVKEAALAEVMSEKNLDRSTWYSHGAGQEVFLGLVDRVWRRSLVEKRQQRKASVDESKARK